jgi:hypothetical protein
MPEDRQAFMEYAEYDPDQHRNSTQSCQNCHGLK